jgi:hypothetical protein
MYGIHMNIYVYIEIVLTSAIQTLSRRMNTIQLQLIENIIDQYTLVS